MPFNYNDDIIDSRDLYKRQCELEDLQSAVTDAQEAFTEAQEAMDEAHEAADSDDDADLIAAREELESKRADLIASQDEFAQPEQDELKMLRGLENEIDGYMHGTTLIDDAYFETYAQQYADDIAGDRKAAEWPFTCIDWERAARELKSDYTSVEIEGRTYYYS